MIDPYVYPGTNILKNKFDIQDVQKLYETERAVTMFKLALYRKQNTIDKFYKFDVEHIKAIHRFLFGDIYDWAGEFRTIDIFKGDSKFYEADKISENLETFCKHIKKAKYFRNVSVMRFDDTSYNLAKTLADLNNIHPFREGNGRVQRLFVEQLALKNYYELDLSKISENDMRDASRSAARGDLKLMLYLVKSNMTDIKGLMKQRRFAKVEDKSEDVSEDDGFDLEL